ncbi:hypothetical protein AVEN_19704-1 [Araneus ventricosus]|uniref:Uncharacterized protein n=1 Tax=Araneus ventricosus TaxID=182803 RepID=A0A4Y2C2H1_ARAVE|nr:hypothetical protein AVEN_19704-1 [Araneus ventricosus]
MTRVLIQELLSEVPPHSCNGKVRIQLNPYPTLSVEKHIRHEVPFTRTNTYQTTPPENCRASIYLCPPFVEEYMNMNTELLDDTFDEIFEETDSEDFNENEMQQLETEVSEDTERCADDGD